MNVFNVTSDQTDVSLLNKSINFLKKNFCVEYNIWIGFY